jgi:hypothetical protein
MAMANSTWFFDRLLMRAPPLGSTTLSFKPSHSLHNRVIHFEMKGAARESEHGHVERQDRLGDGQFAWHWRGDREVGPYGIRVNCIAPETILTERNQGQIPEAQKTALLDSHPIKRLGTPEDVARAALYLASEDASWITGVILDVAGGAVMAQ